MKASRHIVDLIENHRLIEVCLEDLERSARDLKNVLLQIMQQGDDRYGDYEDVEDLKCVKDPREIKVKALIILDEITKEIGVRLVADNKKGTGPNDQSPNK